MMNWKHRNKLLFFQNFHLLFAMLSVAVACSTGASSRSCSRYQRQHHLSAMHKRRVSAYFEQSF